MISAKLLPYSPLGKTSHCQQFRKASSKSLLLCTFANAESVINDDIMSIRIIKVHHHYLKKKQAAKPTYNNQMPEFLIDAAVEMLRARITFLICLWIWICDDDVQVCAAGRKTYFLRCKMHQKKYDKKVRMSNHLSHLNDILTVSGAQLILRYMPNSQIFAIINNSIHNLLHLHVLGLSSAFTSYLLF